MAKRGALFCCVVLACVLTTADTVPLTMADYGSRQTVTSICDKAENLLSRAVTTYAPANAATKPRLRRSL